MSYHISSYTYKLRGKLIREYYISRRGDGVVAGDFRSYKAAKAYLSGTLLRGAKN